MEREMDQKLREVVDEIIESDGRDGFSLCKREDVHHARPALLYKARTYLVGYTDRTVVADLAVGVGEALTNACLNCCDTGRAFAKCREMSDGRFVIVVVNDCRKFDPKSADLIKKYGSESLLEGGRGGLMSEALLAAHEGIQRYPVFPERGKAGKAIVVFTITPAAVLQLNQ